MKTLPFAPMPFPARDLEDMEDIEPFIKAFERARSARHTIRQNSGFERMKKWQRHAWRMFEESQESLFAACDELAIRQLCRTLLIGAHETGIDPRVMLLTYCVCAQGVRRRLVEAGDGAEDAFLWMTGQMDDEQSTNYGERVRGALTDVATSMLRMPGVPPGGISCLRHLQKWVAGAGVQDLRAVFADLEDRDVVDALDVGSINDGPFSEDEIARLQTLFNDLYRNSQKRHRDFADVDERMARMRTHMVGPIDEMLRSEHRTPFAALLCWVYAMGIGGELTPEDQDVNGHRIALDPRYSEPLRLASCDHLFWYVGLTALLRQSGALLGNRLRNRTVDIFEQTILHPTKLLRMKVPQDAIRTRSVLAKRIAPLLKGYHPDVDILGELRVAAESDSAQTIFVLSAYLAGAAGSIYPASGYKSPKHQQTVEYLWEYAIGPHCEAVLSWMARAVGVAVEVFDSTEQEIDDFVKWQPPTDYVQDTKVPDREDHSVPASWFFVSDPKSSSPAIAEFRPEPSDDHETFGDFLRAQKVTTVVKPTSIARALEFYRDMDETIRAQTPYDDINGRRWHKLKRGRQRIYVRVDKDGRLLFHPFARRDWQASWVDLAA